jgi:hypothetical protein
VRTTVSVKKAERLEVGHQCFGGDDDGAGRHSHAATCAKTGPKDAIEFAEVPPLQEVHEAHQFLDGDRSTRCAHAMRDEQNSRGIPGGETILFRKCDDFRAPVLSTPQLCAVDYAQAGSRHDDRSEITHLVENWVGACDTEVVVRVRALPAQDGIEKFLIDVLDLHAWSITWCEFETHASTLVGRGW